MRHSGVDLSIITGDQASRGIVFSDKWNVEEYKIGNEMIPSEMKFVHGYSVVNFCAQVCVYKGYTKLIIIGSEMEFSLGDRIYEATNKLPDPYRGAQIETLIDLYNISNCDITVSENLTHFLYLSSND
jgi:hypothetical protein